MTRLAFVLHPDPAVVRAAARRLNPLRPGRLWSGGRMPAGPDAVVQPPSLFLALEPAPDGAAETDAWIGRQIPAARDDLVAADRAGAVLCNLMNIPPQQDDEFNDWYDTEHMPSLSALPGVLAAARFKAETGDPAYLAIYFLTGLDVCRSAVWREASASPWTRRIQRFRTDNRRLAFLPCPAGAVDT